MEKNIAEQWLRELQTELALLDGMNSEPLERLQHALPMINRIIADVKTLVVNEGFSSEKAEIHFFKRIKPQLYAAQIYEVIYYNLCTQTPVGTSEMIRDFYKEELSQVARLFRLDAFHYQYFRTKAIELDHLYFLRNANPPLPPVLELIDPAPGFSTALDYVFGKFIAYERLQEHLVNLLAGTPVVIRSFTKKGDLRWTGESINLVELAYGIWLTGQVNNGNASVSEIVEWLESHLQVNIGTAFRRWSSISRRKRISQTKYIDQLKDAILKRLDDENGLKV
jgi:RteC protein